jgi:two-component system response regulator VanR
MIEPILIVEDDPSVAEGVRRTLVHHGFDAHAVPDGLSALAWLTTNTPVLIIADIMMPGMNGYQLYQRVRDNPDWVLVPFIFLTARTGVEDIRYGKELGADDYLTKPIEPEDLIAAVRGRLSRYSQLEDRQRPPADPKPAGRYEVGDLVIDLSYRQVTVDEQEVKLSPTEFDILQRLVLADGAVIDYEELLGYDEDELLGSRDAAELLRYHIRNLRGKLKEAEGDEDLIVNVRSVGYRLSTRPTRQMAW